MADKWVNSTDKSSDLSDTRMVVYGGRGSGKTTMAIPSFIVSVEEFLKKNGPLKWEVESNDPYRDPLELAIDRAVEAMRGN